MSRAVSIVAANPGRSILFVAERLLPRAIGKNNAYAYNPVHRAIRAGLITAGRGKGNSYALTVAS
jgi:hypothetical protein